MGKQKPKYVYLDFMTHTDSLKRVEILKHLPDKEILELLVRHDGSCVQEPCRAELTIRNTKALNRFSRASTILAILMLMLMLLNVAYLLRGVIYTALQRLFGI